MTMGSAAHGNDTLAGGTAVSAGARRSGAAGRV